MNSTGFLTESTLQSACGKGPKVSTTALSPLWFIFSTNSCISFKNTNLPHSYFIAFLLSYPHFYQLFFSILLDRGFLITFIDQSSFQGVKKAQSIDLAFYGENILERIYTSVISSLLIKNLHTSNQTIVHKKREYRTLSNIESLYMTSTHFVILK